MTSLEDVRNALSTIAAIVRESGKLKGRVRLQKLGYLLQQRGFPPLARVQFSYHHYGPYSDQLAGALEQAVASGLVREESVMTSQGRRSYNYTLDAVHVDNDYLKLDREESTQVHAFLQATEPKHWRTLELAATVVYLERDMSLPRDTAFDRALGLKPDCKPFRQEATELLTELGFDS